MSKSRTPPAHIRKKLRQEVSFGCPICRSPFLTYHHFDPPWEPLHFHNEKGMIALCSECHRHADGGNYTKDQLRTMKTARYSPPIGALPWGFSDVLVVFGGNFFIADRSKRFVFRIAGRELFALQFADRGYYGIDAHIWDASGNPFIRIENNDILTDLARIGDLECSTQGKEMFISSKANDAELRLRFDRKMVTEIESLAPADDSISSELLRSHLRDLATIVIDTDQLVPTVQLVLGIHGPGFRIDTPPHGVQLDMRGLGYDKALLTGKCFGKFHFKINLGGKEIVLLGNE